MFNALCVGFGTLVGIAVREDCIRDANTWKHMENAWYQINFIIA